jgi:hypothetical protein
MLIEEGSCFETYCGLFYGRPAILPIPSTASLGVQQQQAFTQMLIERILRSDDFIT